MALHVVGAIWDVFSAFGSLAVGSITVHALAVTAARALFDKPANATDKIVHRTPLPQSLRGRPVSLTHLATNRSLACTYRGDISTAWTLEDKINDDTNLDGMEYGLYSMRCGDSAMTSVPLAVLPETEKVPPARQMWSFRPVTDSVYRIVAYRGAGDGHKVLAFSRDALELQTVSKNAAVGKNAASEQLWTIRPAPKAAAARSDGSDNQKKQCAERAGTCTTPPTARQGRPAPSSPAPSSPAPEKEPWRSTTLSSYDVMSFDNTEPGALNEWYVTRTFVDAVNVAAVHSDDWNAYKYRTVEINFKNKIAEFQIWDYCSDKDCDGCCSENRGSNGFLLDLDSSAVKKIWGIEHAEEDLLEPATWRVVPQKTVTDPGAVATRYGGRPS
jgi:hypothetical protein